MLSLYKTPEDPREKEMSKYLTAGRVLGQAGTFLGAIGNWAQICRKWVLLVLECMSRGSFSTITSIIVSSF